MRWRGVGALFVGLVACGGGGEGEPDIYQLGLATMSPNLGPDGLLLQMFRGYVADSGLTYNTIVLATVEGVSVGSSGYTGSLIETAPCFDPEGRLGTVFDGQLHVMSPWGAPWASWDTGGGSEAGPAVDSDGTWMVPAGERLVAVTADGALAFDTPVGGTIRRQPAIGVDGSVALAWQAADTTWALGIVDDDGTLRGSAPLPGPTSWLGRTEDLVVAIGWGGDPATTWVAGFDGGAVTERWVAEVEGTPTGFAQSGDGDVLLALAYVEGGGGLVRLAGSSGAEAARSDLLRVAPGAPSLDDAGRVWASCPEGICTYGADLQPRGKGVEFGGGSTDNVPVALADGWVAVVHEQDLVTFRVPGVQAPDVGWSRIGGGPAGAGRELGR